MASLPFPRRLQLVKLLRAHGLRDVERLREDELKDALAKLSVLLPSLAEAEPTPEPLPFSATSAQADLTDEPVSSAALPMQALNATTTTTPPPPAVDDDNAWCLPRFREPRHVVPEGERTFLRVVAVKPRVLFFTWELQRFADDAGQQRLGEDPAKARLEVALQPYLGEVPSWAALQDAPSALTVDVDLRAPGWYVEVPAERFAVVGRLVQAGHVLALSNLALTPPAVTAPAGPLRRATLAPTTPRSSLRGGILWKPATLPEGVQAQTLGEIAPEHGADAHDRGIEVVVALPSSGEHRFFLPAMPKENVTPSSSSMPSRVSGPSRSVEPTLPPQVGSRSLGRGGDVLVPLAPSSAAMLSSSSSSSMSSAAMAAGRLA
jgi:hypothetical protein